MWGDFMVTRISVSGNETPNDCSTDGQRLLREDNPYTALWVGVIKQAIKEKDIDYLSASNFEEHCNLLSINSELIINALPKVLKRAVLARIKEKKLYE